MGGNGSDEIDGGYGDDSLRGGEDSDRFVFEFTFGNDRIEDFQDGVDFIDLSAFSFSSKAFALSFFQEFGTATDKQAKFVFDANNQVLIKGADLADITDADILI